MDVEGGETHVFDIGQRHLHKLPIVDASWASWAPDGQSIVLSTATQERTSIVLTSLSGAVLATLAEGGGWDASPDAPPVKEACFSASGTQVAYVVTSPEDGTHSLWIMDADGSGQHRLTTGESPAWR